MFHSLLASSSLDLQNSWLKTSESDYSDSDSGRIAKLGVMYGRVRQAALNLLHHIVKVKYQFVSFHIHHESLNVFSIKLEFRREINAKMYLGTK